MTGSNYESWEIRPDEFLSLQDNISRMNFFVKFGVLAPSSHNSQPWKFKVESNIIEIYLDTDRTLPEGDSNNRQAFISIGCATRNIVIAADFYGYDVKMNLRDNGIRLEFNKVGTNLKTQDLSEHFLHLITKRKVNRGKYDNKNLDSGLENFIKLCASDKIKVNLISNPEIKNRLSKVALDATSSSMSNSKFRNELSKYVIPNSSKSEIGMPGIGLGFPKVISYIAPFMLKHFNMSVLSNKKDKVVSL